jgi:uncharacterized protein with HEPN domain
MSSPRDHGDYISDIIEASQAALGFTDGVEFEEFADDLQKTYAVLHALTVIGEAAKNIPVEVLLRYPEIPWREVTGMRDSIAHGYFGLDLRVVWDTVREDLPKLTHVATAMLEEYDAPPA